MFVISLENSNYKININCVQEFVLNNLFREFCFAHKSFSNCELSAVCVHSVPANQFLAVVAPHAGDHGLFTFVSVQSVPRGSRAYKNIPNKILKC